MPEPDVPILRLTELTKSFGNVKAVDRLSLEVRRGEILGFLGPNGAGKTTTIRMMCGLLRPDGGQVQIDGRTAASCRRIIGFSPQSISIWDTLTCLEQLDFMARAYGIGAGTARRRADELLATFGLEDKRNKLGRTLSGGMKRRLNIALALVHDPAILFLDEPQAGLDPQSRVLVRDYVRGLARRTTVVLTTHDMEEAEKLSDRVSIIDHGRLLELGTVAEVKGRLGRGDLVELEIAEDIETALMPHLPVLDREWHRAGVGEKTLTLVSEEAAGLLPEVLGVIRDRRLNLVNLRLRPKTLEDVFIHLTGRGLRE
jgi:ABC-2 type transport system ATP-binding protein